MTRAAVTAQVMIAGCFALGGCAGPVAAYHDLEGGAIAQTRQAPPGVNLPYPNLASVPTVPTPPTEQAIASVGARLAPVPAPQPQLVPNEAALEGLALPGAPPPAPNVPGVYVPAVAAPHVLVYAPPAAPAPPAPAPPDSTPVSLAFEPGSAILDGKTVDALNTLADTVNPNATVVVGGFGKPGAAADAAALTLALDRARAIADALTAAGVPAGQLVMVAGARGSGGFVQLRY
jgi:outer membrane protein OmpA-like peptidoglycan-associated protein